MLYIRVLTYKQYGVIFFFEKTRQSQTESRESLPKLIGGDSAKHTTLQHTATHCDTLSQRFTGQTPKALLYPRQPLVCRSFWLLFRLPDYPRPPVVDTYHNYYHCYHAVNAVYSCLSSVFPFIHTSCCKCCILSPVQSDSIHSHVSMMCTYVYFICVHICLHIHI